MYLLSQIKRNPAITTVTKRGIIGGGRGLLSSSLRNIKALLIYESGSLGLKPVFLWVRKVHKKARGGRGQGVASGKPLPDGSKTLCELLFEVPGIAAHFRDAEFGFPA